MNLIYWLSESGGKFGAPIVFILALVILLTAIVFAGGGAAINEHVIKAELEVPRPNIIWLASEGGYSFPSGHAFSAMFFATFLLLTGATCLTKSRLSVLYLLAF